MPVIYRILTTIVFVLFMALPFLVQRYEVIAQHTSQLVIAVFVCLTVIALSLAIHHKSKK